MNSTTNKLTTEDKELMDSLINSYRDVIYERYQYETLKKNFEIPEGVTEEVVNSIRGYFLKFIYPDAEDRIRLSKGFESLKRYASDPTKIFKMIGSLSGAIFKFSFYLPRAIRAALHSWDAYRNAKIIEIELLKSAHKLGLSVPVSKDDILACLLGIPKEMLLKFSEEVLFLFESFMNQALLSKTVGILDAIGQIMKDNPETYSEKDVDAMLMGRAIIQEGANLLSQHDDNLKEKIVKTIYDIEMGYLKMLYEKSV